MLIGRIIGNAMVATAILGRDSGEIRALVDAAIWWSGAEGMGAGTRRRRRDVRLAAQRGIH